MTRAAAPARVTNTQRVYELLCQYAEDTRGVLCGLTGSELRFVWRMRRGSMFPRSALSALVDAGLVRRLRHRRVCDASGDFRMPWVPTAMLDDRAAPGHPEGSL